MKRLGAALASWIGSLGAGVLWGLVAVGWFTPLAEVLPPPFSLIAAVLPAFAASVAAVVFGPHLSARAKAAAALAGSTVGIIAVVAITSAETGDMFALLLLMPVPLALPGVVASVVRARTWSPGGGAAVFWMLVVLSLGGILAVAASSGLAAANRDMQLLYLAFSTYLVCACALLTSVTAGAEAVLRALRDRQSFGVE